MRWMGLDVPAIDAKCQVLLNIPINGDAKVLGMLLKRSLGLPCEKSSCMLLGHATYWDCFESTAAACLLWHACHEECHL